MTTIFIFFSKKWKNEKCLELLDLARKLIEKSFQTNLAEFFLSENVGYKGPAFVMHYSAYVWGYKLGLQFHFFTYFCWNSCAIIIILIMWLWGDCKFISLSNSIWEGVPASAALELSLMSNGMSPGHFYGFIAHYLCSNWLLEHVLSVVLNKMHVMQSDMREAVNRANLVRGYFSDRCGHWL